MRHGKVVASIANIVAWSAEQQHSLYRYSYYAVQNSNHPTYVKSLLNVFAVIHTVLKARTGWVAKELPDNEESLESSAGDVGLDPLQSLLSSSSSSGDSSLAVPLLSSLLLSSSEVSSGGLFTQMAKKNADDKLNRISVWHAQTESSRIILKKDKKKLYVPSTEMFEVIL